MKRLIQLAAVAAMIAGTVAAKEWPGFTRGMGIGGWLTNYKRFNVLPENHRLPITIGDLEHFDTYITEKDIAYIKKRWASTTSASDSTRIVLEEAPGKYRERTFKSWTTSWAGVKNTVSTWC